MPSGARRTRSPRSTSCVALSGLVRSPAPARPPSAFELELGLDQDVSSALRHRPVELILVVGKADPRHFADRDAAILELRADVETLHRFVEVRLDRDPLLEPAARADDQQHHDTGGNRADHEQTELEIVGSLAHREGNQAAASSGFAAEELANPRVVARVAQLPRIALGDDPLRALVEHDHAIGDREDARELVGDDDERDAERLLETADRARRARPT